MKVEVNSKPVGNAVIVYLVYEFPRCLYFNMYFVLKGHCITTRRNAAGQT
jgi:hypothetical protein